MFASDTSQTASSVKPSITPSIQYWERTAWRGVAVDRERPVVGQDQGGHVARDDEADLQYHSTFAPIRPYRLGARGPEDVGAVAQRIGGQETIAWPW